ncbi:hypothetical protein B0G81_7861 [Paraburkholderia sp. BL6665CI2N2]|nr:hypothetical protein B0G81_7861 [Paraburkholderia sp. BL6665CI2N2]
MQPTVSRFLPPRHSNPWSTRKQLGLINQTPAPCNLESVSTRRIKSRSTRGHKPLIRALLLPMDRASANAQSLASHLALVACRSGHGTDTTSMNSCEWCIWAGFCSEPDTATVRPRNSGSPNTQSRRRWPMLTSVASGGFRKRRSPPSRCFLLSMTGSSPVRRCTKYSRRSRSSGHSWPERPVLPFPRMADSRLDRSRSSGRQAVVGRRVNAIVRGRPCGAGFMSRSSWNRAPQQAAFPSSSGGASPFRDGVCPVPHAGKGSWCSATRDRDCRAPCAGRHRCQPGASPMYVATSARGTVQFIGAIRELRSADAQPRGGVAEYASDRVVHG